MERSVALVTGAGGEMGHLLVPALQRAGHDVVGLDLEDLPPELRAKCTETVRASVLDFDTIDSLIRRVSPGLVFHLAAVLSAKAERDPDLAHRVNVTATVELFRLFRKEATRRGADVRFLFPSTIAVYGLPDRHSKDGAGAVPEERWNAPAGAYGCNKLYCELLGSYFASRTRATGKPGLDFRCIRFPGLISADTLPTSGTSDYAPQMIHAAAQGKPYACFVDEGTRLPFMTMPDGVSALLALAGARSSDLSTRVYNIRAFSPTAGEIRDAVGRHFPDARITFDRVTERQRIVDTWPGDVDDRRARRDWGHRPKHDLEGALAEYLVPALQLRYATKTG